MFLSQLARCVNGARVVCGAKNTQTAEVEIFGLTDDSRFCRKGDLFFCLTGGKTDPHIYARDAQAAGAAAVVSERELPLDIPQIVVPDPRKAMPLMAAEFYARPAEKLKIVGITGTNGKTTVSYMLAAILRRAGKKVAVVGTLGIYYGKTQIAPELTTPDPIFLHKTFADMVKNGVEYVVIEISAHALFYKKDEGLKYAACIFTNFTQDHLDFFGNMQNYKAAKKLLFSLDKCPVAILNGDDALGREIGKMRHEEKGKNLFYGLDTPSDSFAVLTSETLKGVEFMLNLSDNLSRISLPMTGKHNVYNAMAAATCAYALGIRTEAVAGGLNNMRPVRGRLEYVAKFRGADIFVDFAHTPDGLEKSLSALKPHCKGRLICLFGCGGNRDKTKRAIMGETVARKADLSVLTSDNPRYEDPSDIIAEIERGYRRFSIHYAVLPDRTEAIEYAVGLLKKGDVLLVAGKGGEEHQEIMGIKYSYNDNAVIKEAISKKSDDPL
jgi:UDP-N-acetylmuramoyl-L-alanyl-D-glutamate--2,6-diaminopimelate ligase